MSEGVDLHLLLEFAGETAQRAGELLLEGLSERGASERLAAAATKSSPTDLVTELDRASEALIVKALRTRRPEDGLLGEEGTSRAGSSGLTWVIDPLDGTTNFVYGYGSFAVSIALVDAGGPLLGVVHDPLRGETFSAARGLGAHLDGRRLAAPAASGPLSEALLGTGFGYDTELRVAQARLLPTVLGAVRDLRRGGSAALDLCSVASGRLDGYFEAGLAPWDRAAGELVVTEAGGVVLEVSGLHAGRTTLVASPPDRLEALLALLASAAEGATR